MAIWKPVLLAAALFCGIAPAKSQILEEIRLGAAAHDLTEPTEGGEQIVVEAVFASPEFFPGWLLDARPYAYGSFNTQGYTNLGAAGLAWSRDLAPRFRLEGSFGIAYHDGVKDLPPATPENEADRIRLSQTRALLGSNFLFRTQLAVDYRVSPRLYAGVFYEHFSHGQILGSGRNQGLDELGGRLVYRFGEAAR